MLVEDNLIANCPFCLFVWDLLLFQTQGLPSGENYITSLGFCVLVSEARFLPSVAIRMRGLHSLSATGFSHLKLTLATVIQMRLEKKKKRKEARNMSL